MKSIVIIRQPVTRAYLRDHLLEGAFAKAVVDVSKRIMAVGGELHSDEEAELLELGSEQHDLWGINLYPDDPSAAWIEFDSMINLRPSQGNRSRGVDDPGRRQSITSIVTELIKDV